MSEVNKSVLLVDCENVGTCVPVDLLSKKNFDEIVLFVGPNQKNICIETLLLIQKNSKKYSITKIPRPGKNALDFVLSVEAGAYASSGYDVTIVSNDKGFDDVLQHVRSSFSVQAFRKDKPQHIIEDKQNQSKNPTKNKS